MTKHSQAEWFQNVTAALSVGKSYLPLCQQASGDFTTKSVEICHIFTEDFVIEIYYILLVGQKSKIEKKDEAKVENESSAGVYTCKSGMRWNVP